tara:strand:- start:1881 stop:2030 length:150 start_codon:yes stop_codon:yes gene_type:complete
MLNGKMMTDEMFKALLLKLDPYYEEKQEAFKREIEDKYAIDGDETFEEI